MIFKKQQQQTNKQTNKTKNTKEERKKETNLISSNSRPDWSGTIMTYQGTLIADYAEILGKNGV